MEGLIVIGVLALFALFVAFKTIKIIPQARAGVVERLGRFSRTLDPGLAIVIPFIDSVKPLIDLREQVVSFRPQSVITKDNVTVNIDTVLYFTITDPRGVTYEVANPLQAIEQLTVTTLRNVIGSLTLEEALTSRDSINTQLRSVLDEATGRWGIRVNRVELKSIDPPATIQEAMEKQMRAERDRRAAILNAEGVKQSQILTAEGEKQSAVLKAEGAKTAAILRAEGESKAIEQVFEAIHAGKPDQQLLSYQYLQMLPQLAQGDANKIWVIPSEFSQALGGLAAELVERAPAAAVSESPEDLAARFTTPPDHYLAEIAEATEAEFGGRMLSGGVIGRLLETLVYLAQPKLVLEVGTFTGYSALAMARALPPDGRVITLEADPKHAAFARRRLDRHGRIAIREGDALESIAQLDGPFDLVFLDAAKSAYVDHYEAVLPKLAPRGLIVADDTLFDSVQPFNAHVADDPRVVQVLLPFDDGVTIIRRA
jgi:regulator of protease activity HflC (stomatin/prohibitin superfamily)/predicted O-methyltransferase YrrM